MKNLSEILESTDKHSEKAEQLKELITHNVKKTRTLLNKTNLSNDEKVELEDISKETQLILQTNLFKHIEVSFVKLVREVLHNTSTLTLQELFFYEPDARSNKAKSNFRYNSNDAVVYQHNKVVGKFAVGSDPIINGMINDVASHENPNILKIKKLSENADNGFLYDASITDDYTLSFQFKLNRFPSKVYTQLAKKNPAANPAYSKRITSRRTDILSLNYSQDGLHRIEIGAMAPNVNRSNVPVYDNQYAPYSICASISVGNPWKYSVYTDYKFELGEIQYLTLKIKKVPDVGEQYIIDFENAFNAFNAFNSSQEIHDETFEYDNRLWGVTSAAKEIANLRRSLGNTWGGPSRYTISLTVNGVSEDIGNYYGKVWSSQATQDKKQHYTIASGPGFMPRDYKEETRWELSVKNSNIAWEDLLNFFEARGFNSTINTKDGYPAGDDVIITSDISSKNYDDCLIVMDDWNKNTKNSHDRFTLTPYTWRSKSPRKHSKERNAMLPGINLNTLYSVTSAPGNINNTNRTKDGQLLAVAKVVEFKRIYNKYNYKMNNGIDIGAIRINAAVNNAK